MHFREKNHRKLTLAEMFFFPLSALKGKENELVPFSFGRFTLFHPGKSLF